MNLFEKCGVWLFEAAFIFYYKFASRDFPLCLCRMRVIIHHKMRESFQSAVIKPQILYFQFAIFRLPPDANAVSFVRKDENR